MKLKHILAEIMNSLLYKGRKESVFIFAGRVESRVYFKEMNENDSRKKAFNMMLHTCKTYGMLE